MPARSSLATDATTATIFRSASSSKGLEGEAFDDAAVRGARARCWQPRARYPIAAVAGHEHVAPGRKSDPGAGFDWARAAPSRAAREAALARPERPTCAQGLARPCRGEIGDNRIVTNVRVRRYR